MSAEPSAPPCVRTLWRVSWIERAPDEITYVTVEVKSQTARGAYDVACPPVHFSECTFALVNKGAA